MSQTYSIACTQCKCRLWIGQSSVYSNWRIYTSEEFIEALRDFLWEHQTHPLVFGDSCEGQMCIEQWKEIEVKLPKKWEVKKNTPTFKKGKKPS